jgi:hypothetical protein
MHLPCRLRSCYSSSWLVGCMIELKTCNVNRIEKQTRLIIKKIRQIGIQSADCIDAANRQNENRQNEYHHCKVFWDQGLKMVCLQCAATAELAIYAIYGRYERHHTVTKILSWRLWLFLQLNYIYRCYICYQCLHHSMRLPVDTNKICGDVSLELMECCS